MRRVLGIASTNLTLWIAVLFSLYPMWVMLINSFKADAEVHRNPAGLPQVWTVQGYESIFTMRGGLWSNFMVSVIVSGASLFLALFICSLAAYGFSKFEFKAKALLFGMLMSSIMVPVEVTIPARFIMFAKLDLLNTLVVQILPRMAPIVGLFLMRQYMLDIPDELLEAARIDGASHFGVYWRIMIPVCKPILGAYAILHFMGTWNAYTWPSLVAQRREIQPIMVVLPTLTDPDYGHFRLWGTIMAGCTLSIIPILIVFARFQDFFLTSMTIGSLKG